MRQMMMLTGKTGGFSLDVLRPVKQEGHVRTRQGHRALMKSLAKHESSIVNGTPVKLNSLCLSHELRLVFGVLE